MMHALIIEDEALIAMAIEDALLTCGFTSFEVAASAQDAMAAAARKCPDLITADVELRPGSGIDAVQSICCGKTDSRRLHYRDPREGEVKDARSRHGREAVQCAPNYDRDQTGFGG